MENAKHIEQHHTWTHAIWMDGWMDGWIDRSIDINNRYNNNKVTCKLNISIERIKDQQTHDMT